MNWVCFGGFGSLEKCYGVLKDLAEEADIENDGNINGKSSGKSQKERETRERKQQTSITE